MKLGLPGWMRSSASTQMPLVSFRDWYSMSCPSTFLLATVKMLLLCSLLLTASGGQRHPQSVTGEGLGAGEGQYGWSEGCSGVLPALRGQSLIWNWASFSLGMSFHVARNICRSEGKGDKRWDPDKLVAPLSNTEQEMGLP